jgi:flagellar basal-body rod protein FlgB
VVTDRSTAAGLDDNNVDIESQMAALAKNSIEYYTLVNKVNSEFRKLDTAISVT